MINLIPKAARNKVKLEYWVRVASVWSFLFAAALLAATTLMIPLYILTTAELEAIQSERQRNLASEAEYTETQEAIEAANALTARLIRSPQRIEATRIVDTVNERIGGGIELRNFILRGLDGKEVSVQVQGTAADRESLAAFRDRLERAPLFRTAHVPISDLAREVNLPFVVTLSLTEAALRAR